jgi:hypothetical protein
VYPPPHVAHPTRLLTALAHTPGIAACVHGRPCRTSRGEETAGPGQFAEFGVKMNLGALFLSSFCTNLAEKN